jgi:DNA-binding transcriptional regulator LsrR (DeoR family)
MDKPTVSQEYELLTEIAVAYYCDEVTQEEIANKFGFSRIKVGRLLKRAKEEGSLKSTCATTLSSAPNWKSN